MFHVDGLYWDDLTEAQTALAAVKTRKKGATLLWCDGNLNWDIWDGQPKGLYQITDKSLERVLDEDGNWLYIA